MQWRIASTRAASSTSITVSQDEVLKTIHDGDPEASGGSWDRLPTHYFWMLLLQDAIGAYYAHPWAWDEVGFGGPAYPRAYMRLEHGMPEPWEVNEKRYEWNAPETSVSDRFEPIGGHAEHSGTPGARRYALKEPRRRPPSIC